MKKPNLMKYVRNVQRSLDKHSPEILTVAGIGLGFTTVILAVKATPKAMELINDAKMAKMENQLDDGVKVDDLDDNLNVLETAKLVWKPYIPAVVTGTLSVTCLIGAQKVTARRTAALATAYKISETALKDYKDAVIETVGETKEKAVREKIAEKKVEQTPLNPNQVIATGKGSTLCFDAWSGRYFYSDIEVIRKAENVLNRRMMMDMSGYASLNDFYIEIGLETTEAGDILGWNICDGLINLSLWSKLLNEKDPCAVIDFGTEPRYAYTESF